MAQLTRQLGCLTAAFTVIGSMIGSGVFRTSNELFFDVHLSPMVILALWAVGGLVALAGAKEEIQSRRTTPSANDVVQYAAGRARHALGVEWTLANCKPGPMVFGPPDRWEGDDR